ncbi:MAG: deoxyribodipyrimidine photo-lyase [Flammeovirgaceae bacterium]|nr:deoxyribodipyrimidine photo-lyase [Flammeovirgaceae bacterium]
MNSETTLFWFRRDLRIVDNVGLSRALQENNNVLPLFIFDSVILNELEKHDRRVDFIHQTLLHLKHSFEKQGSSILILYGDPVEILTSLHPKAVYTNHDYEPYGRQRDETIKETFARANIPFVSFKDQVIFEKDEIIKDDGSPYTMYTPYSKKWKTNLDISKIKIQKPNLSNLLRTPPLIFPTISEIGFEKTDIKFSLPKIDRNVLSNYSRNRDYPAQHGTSRLSVHLRFGTIGIRTLLGEALKHGDKFLNELIWRDFYQMILYHFPATHKSFKPKYDRIEWRNNILEFNLWCKGKTGYPIVDAGMRELNSTGFMHNRVRMITASFLTKHLLIDWRWGESYFAQKLLDFDLASNNGGWQWASGSGVDAAPYFRIFNPYLQTKKFDPENNYVKKWIPEFGSQDYPKPIVDHEMARRRALDVYKRALTE